MNLRFSIILLLTCVLLINVNAQNIQSADSINPPSDYENVYSKNIGNDSLSSSFVIFIKKQVKLHKHEYHTEQVIVLEGEAEMLLGDKKIKIKKGDIILIPKNTPHSVTVTSVVPLKVISIQSPYFDGKDRVLLEK
jgi:mannose-6-phosphate isomerase-like protein (cupin superfamily)